MISLGKIGIYIIINNINFKFYLGSSSQSFKQRKKAHFRALQNNEHFSVRLQNAWNKYGEENFSFIPIKIINKKQNVLRTEQWYLDCFEPWRPEIGYNTCKIAGSTLGYKYSIDKINEISLKRSNTILDFEKAKEILRLYLIGLYPNEIAERYNVKRETVSRIINRKSWKYISDINEKELSKLIEKRKQMNKGSWIPKGEARSDSKLNEKQVLEIREKYNTGRYEQKDLANQYGVKVITIRKVLHSISWKHIENIITPERLREIENKRKSENGKLNKGRKYSEEVNKKKSNVGEKNASSILAEEQVKEIRAKYDSGKYSQKELAKEYNVNQTTISGIVLGKSWSHLKENIKKSKKERVEDNVVIDIRKKYDTENYFIKDLMKEYNLGIKEIKHIVYLSEKYINIDNIYSKERLEEIKKTLRSKSQQRGNI